MDDINTLKMVDGENGPEIYLLHPPRSLELDLRDMDGLEAQRDGYQVDPDSVSDVAELFDGTDEELNNEL